MKQTTAITRQDLKIYKSQRLTDTPDGGGMMTNIPLTGADNELFDPISDVDNTMGALDARLIYPAVLRPDDHKLLGANVIVSQPPQASNASVLLVPADYFGQERASIMERIEAYRVATVENRMTLFGTQLKGSRLVRVYQLVSAALPVVGDVLALRVMVNDVPVYDFVRIEKFTHSIETFEEKGVEFQRRVIEMVTQQPLERDFVGVERASRDEVLPPARVMNTQIADSAKYYGIKPLAEPIVQGAASLKLPSVYEQLVPVSTIETPMADDWASGKEAWIETAPRRDVYTGYRPWQNGEKLYLETGVLPASVQIDGYTDDGMGNLVNGDKRLLINYADGTISGFDGQTINKISAIPAIKVRNYAYSAVIDVDDTNVGTEWTPLLRPKPAKGSVGVDFMSAGEWYQLGDVGDFGLRDSQNVVRGQISKNGSAIISLPTQPDSGAPIIFTWTPEGFYKNFDGTDTGNAILPTSLNTVFRLPENPKTHLKPNTIRLSWHDGAAQNAQDANGTITGAASGWVDYVAGVVYPQNLRAASVQIHAEQYIGSVQRKAVAVNDGDVMTFSAETVIQAGTLQISLPIGRKVKPDEPPVYNSPNRPLAFVSA